MLLKVAQRPQQLLVGAACNTPTAAAASQPVARFKIKDVLTPKMHSLPPSLPSARNTASTHTTPATGKQQREFQLPQGCAPERPGPPCCRSQVREALRPRPRTQRRASRLPAPGQSAPAPRPDRALQTAPTPHTQALALHSRPPSGRAHSHSPMVGGHSRSPSAGHTHSHPPARYTHTHIHP